MYSSKCELAYFSIAERRHLLLPSSQGNQNTYNCRKGGEWEEELGKRRESQ